MSRPVSITLAVILQWVGALVALLLGFDLMASGAELTQKGVGAVIDEALRRQDVADVSSDYVIVALFFAGAVVCVIALVRIVVAVYLWRGRDWARIVLAVLTVVNVVGNVTYLVRDQSLRAGVVLVLDFLMLYLMFNVASSRYIAARSQERRAEVAA